MNVEANLNQVLEMRYLSVPKEQYPKLSLALGADAVERADHWQLPCSHIIHDSAMEADLAALASQIAHDVPVPLQRLLSVTDGADLFRIHYQPTGFDDYWIPRYRVLSAASLAEVYQGLLDVFLSYAEFDEKHRETQELNYLAFCDVGDGNYLAVNLEESKVGSVFFLDHEYGFYPYRDDLAVFNAYADVAGSIDEWLAQLAQSGGWDGLGGRFVPL